MEGYKSLTSKDPRYTTPSGGKPRDRTLTTTAREEFATGKNELKEHSGMAGAKRPGGSRGHGGN